MIELSALALTGSGAGTDPSGAESVTNRGSDEQVGGRLSTIRGFKNWTQTDTARLMGVSLATYQTYEHNKRRPNSDSLAPLAKEGINLHWLITGTGAMVDISGPLATLDEKAVPAGHSSTFPGHCTVVDQTGALISRPDLVPEVLAPVLEWISAGVALTGDQTDWTWAARQVIGRYEWDFMVWLNAQRSSRPATPGGGSWS
jgi:transcriptional regulator with XRE-family HTH domain